MGQVGVRMLPACKFYVVRNDRAAGQESTEQKTVMCELVHQLVAAPDSGVRVKFYQR